jgi:hypothetical protein
MTDRATSGDEVDSVEECAEGPAVRSPAADADTDAYEVEGGVVIYDVDNPLAWIEAGKSVDVERMA